MTTVFTRTGAMAEQVRAESRQLDPAKVALTLVMVLPFVVGWVAGMAARAVWWLVAIAWSAAVVGYRTARPPGPEGG